MSFADLAITGVIVLVVLFSAVRAGQLSPVGTGRLAKRINALELKVSAQATIVDRINEDVQGVMESQARTREVLESLRIELASDRGLTERTWAAVDRLQHFFIEDSFERRKERT